MARDGWKLLGEYRFNPVSGLWRHRAGPVEPPLRLRDISYAADGTMHYPRHDSTASVTVLDDYLDDARRILSEALPARAEDAAQVSVPFDHLRWFDLPAISLDH